MPFCVNVMTSHRYSSWVDSQDNLLLSCGSTPVKTLVAKSVIILMTPQIILKFYKIFLKSPKIRNFLK